MANAKLGAGNVTITLDGEDYTLKPSLRAAQTLSRQAGGLIAALEAVGRLDLDAMVSVIALGIGAEGAEAKALAEKVWRTGVADVSAPVTRFISIIANGGRPPEATGGEEDADPRSA